MPASRRSRCRPGALVLSLVLALACNRAPEPEGNPGDRALFPEPPDVILLVVDTLRRDHVGACGYHRETTPFLDRLAAHGVLFENAWAQASQTFISTATLFTSRYFPLLVENAAFRPIPGLNEELQKLHAQVPAVCERNLTLPEVLRAGGYETAGFFTNPHHHPTSGFWQGFDRADYLLPSSGAQAYARGPMVHRAFFQWLDERQADRPYFAYLHFMDVHAPYRPPRAERNRWVTIRGDQRWASGKPMGDERPTAEDVAYAEALYDAEIRFADGVVKALVTDLRGRDRWRRTLLVITSDHGEEFMDHGGLLHGRTLENELIRIPLIFAGGGLEEGRLPNRRRPELVRNLDLAPTIVELAGIAVPPQFNGRSLVPWLGWAGASPLVVRGHREGIKPRLRAEVRESRPVATSYAWIGSLRSLTSDQWHLIRNVESGKVILYDRQADAAGHRNVAAEHGGVVARLAADIAKLEALRQSGDDEDRPPEAAPREIDPAIVEQLRALGYL